MAGRWRSVLWAAPIAGVFVAILAPRRENSDLHDVRRYATQVQPAHPVAGARIEGRLIGAGDGEDVFLIAYDHLAARSPFREICDCEHCEPESWPTVCDDRALYLARWVLERDPPIKPERAAETIDGRFVFEGLSAGKYVVWTAAAHAVTEHIASGDTFSIDIAPKPRTLRARVMAQVEDDEEEGLPIPSARVFAVDLLLGETRSAAADRRGEAAISNVDGDRRWWVIATADTFVPEGWISVELDADPIVLADPFSFHLAPAHSLRGIVFENGRPIRGVTIDVGDDQKPTITDDRGRFYFSTLAPGHRYLRATIGDRGGYYDLGEAPAHHAVEIEIAALCALSVEARSVSDAPIEGARVEVISKEQETPATEEEDEEEEQHPRPLLLLGGSGVTSPAGTAQIADLSEGGYEIKIEHESYGFVTKPLSLHHCAKAPRPKIALVLGDESGLRGVLLDPERRPLAAVEVEARRGWELDIAGRRSVRTDRDGKFHLPSLGLGTWRLTADVPPFVWFFHDADVFGDRDQELTLILEHGHPLRCQLTFEGEPLENWELTVRAGDLSYSARADKDGWAEVERVAAGRHKVCARGSLDGYYEARTVGECIEIDPRAPSCAIAVSGALLEE